MIGKEDIKIGQILIERETGEKFVCIDTNFCEDNYYSEINIIPYLCCEKYSGKVSLECIDYITIQNGCDGFDCDYEFLNSFVDISKEEIINFGDTNNKKIH